MKNFITPIPTKDQTIIDLEAREHKLWTELRAIKGNGYKANSKRRMLKAKMSACQQNIEKHYQFLREKQGITQKSIY
tara:strand:- start:190 stop:420 length:231 start_codon:yes stop_codon:yes gene_type:complete